MSDASYFSRRLLPDETAIWTGLLPPDEPPDDPHLTQSYMNLDDSMFFAFFLGDETVGISTIYRDRVRMSILLCSLRVLEEYRERITKHIIKTSLPFFKTAAIREAEAVVNLTSSAEGIPFPLVTEIGPWALGALTENGFRKVGDYVRIRFRVPETKLDYTDNWDKKESTSEDLKELLWNTDERERPDHAPLWLGFALGRERGIYTSSIDNNTRFAMSFQPTRQTFVVTSLLYDPKSVSHEDAAARVIDLARMNRYDQVVLPLLSNSSPVIGELRNMCGNPVSEIPLELMRKPL